MVKTAVKNGFQDSRSAFIEIKGRGFDQIWRWILTMMSEVQNGQRLMKSRNLLLHLDFPKTSQSSEFNFNQIWRFPWLQKISIQTNQPNHDPTSKIFLDILILVR
jgi:hypothetical protein